MRRLKYVFSLAMVVLMLVSLFTACDTGVSTKTVSGGKVEAYTGKVKVGLSMQTLGAPYFVAQKDAFEKKCQELGYDYVSLDAGGDVSKQQSDVEDLIAQKCTAIILNPADAQGCVAIANNAMDKGIPVFIMDNSIAPEAKYVSMIQSNNRAIGALVGQWVAKQMGSNEIRIGMLSGNAGNLLGLDRRMGVMQGIIEAQLEASGVTNVKIVAQGWGGWGQDSGLTAAEDMIQSAPSLNVIVAENDSMGLGAQIALQNAGRNDVIVVGIDGQKEALALVQDGKYGASGLNDPVKVAHTTLEAIQKYLGGDRDILKLINTEPAVITKDNVSQYYNADSVF